MTLPATPSFLPFALPDIGEEEIAEVVDTLRSGWVTTGPKAKRFEDDFSAFLGDLTGQVFAMFVLTVAAGEAAIGLAILVIYFRGRGTIAVDDVNRMKG